MASVSWHKRILKALAVLTTCTTYTKEDGDVEVTQKSAEKVARLTTGREE